MFAEFSCRAMEASSLELKGSSLLKLELDIRFLEILRGFFRFYFANIACKTTNFKITFPLRLSGFWALERSKITPGFAMKVEIASTGVPG